MVLQDISSIFFLYVYGVFVRIEFLQLKVPQSHGRSDHYEVMNLGHNMLHTLPSYSLEKFPGLTTLNLSFNYISEVKFFMV